MAKIVMFDRTIDRCHVVQIRDKIAYVDMMSGKVIVAYAEMDAEALAAHDIRDNDLFEIDEEGSELKFTKIPRKPLSAEQMAEIDRKINEALPDSLFDEDDRI